MTRIFTDIPYPIQIKMSLRSEAIHSAMYYFKWIAAVAGSLAMTEIYIFCKQKTPPKRSFDLCLYELLEHFDNVHDDIGNEVYKELDNYCDVNGRNKVHYPEVH